MGGVNQPQDLINGLDHRPQASHGHYRHNSKAQGHYQHSRNTSYVNSPATSPLSPQNGGSYSANGAGAPEYSSLTIIHHGASNRRPTESSTSTVIAVSSHSSTSTLVGDREQGDGSATANSQRRADPGNSGRGRRGHSHHRSQSKQQFLQEPTTVGEYALQHLFEAVGNSQCPRHNLRLTHRQFVRQADHKINQCILNAANSHFRVEDICGPGIDPSFDQLIAALGHIARQKPRPLIDTIMYWRKAKGEAFTNAHREVHQV